MRNIDGVSQQFVTKFGSRLVSKIREFCETHPTLTINNEEGEETDSATDGIINKVWPGGLRGLEFTKGSQHLDYHSLQLIIVCLGSYKDS